jgi:sirohydrochlorin ferrochelatase
MSASQGVICHDFAAAIAVNAYEKPQVRNRLQAVAKARARIFVVVCPFFDASTHQRNFG